MSSPRKVFVLLIFPCRKHHCQVHPIGTNTLAMDLKLNYNPKSDYQLTFAPKQFQAAVRPRRPGLAVPARILPEAVPPPMDFHTVSQRDFVKMPIIKVNKSTMKHNLRLASGAFQDVTSYRSDFPKRAFDLNPTAASLRRNTWPQPIEVQPNYLTTNQCDMRKWSGLQRSIPYKELQEERFFTGDFQKESVTAKEFSKYSVKGGKPGTSCKKMAVRHAPRAVLMGRQRVRCRTNFR